MKRNALKDSKPLLPKLAIGTMLLAASVPCSFGILAGDPSTIARPAYSSAQNLTAEERGTLP